MPFERNPKFTGRKELLDDLVQKLQQSTNTKRIAVFGLGGVGKTQLVLELAYQMQQLCAVFWIPVNSLANLQGAFYEVAKKLRLLGCEKDGDHIVELVQSYLSDESIGPWLLVLDNADDLSLWNYPFSLESGQKRLIDLLPKSTHGSIIFTTRNRKVTSDFVQDMVEVPEMDEPEATHLLKATAGVSEFAETDHHVVPILLETLTYLPLAIVQAASYIRKNGVSFSRYTELLMDQEDDVINILGEEFYDKGRYHDVSHAVAKTWIISFQQICRDDHLAAEYLSLMACVDHKDIPQSILVEGSLRRTETNAIGTLDAYSFTKKHSDSTMFDMHCLVHLATRSWLKEQDRLSSWQGKVVLRLTGLLANVDQTNQAQWRLYISHAQFAVMDHDTVGDEIIDLAAKCGRCLEYDGRYREAETMYQIVLGHRERVLGSEHPHTLASIGSLALVLSDQGKYEEAEAMHQEALRDQEKVLGPEHPDTLASISSLGLVLSHQGKYEEAEAMHQQALEGSEKVLGPEHPDTLASISNLGNVLDSEGKYEEAEAMHQKALKDKEKVLGPEHPGTLTSISSLALVLSHQGKYEEAEAMHRRGLDGSEKVLGPDHPDTLASVSNLGNVLDSQGKYEEAEAMHQKALRDKEKVLGPEHPHTLTSTNNLALVLSHQGKYEEAKAVNLRKPRN